MRGGSISLSNDDLIIKRRDEKKPVSSRNGTWHKASKAHSIGTCTLFNICTCNVQVHNQLRCLKKYVCFRDIKQASNLIETQMI